ncbi:MAG TPA: patatin-like phospholipase family protein [Xanthobacteraceae bacterium]|nr:patatin-like phospholipase family protein [Xanthobacteraceae bacterium]
MKSKLALASLAMIAILIGVSASPSLFSPSLSSGVAFAQNDNGAPEKGAVQEKAAPKKDAQKKAVQKTEPKKSDTQHKDSQKRSAQKSEPHKATPQAAHQTAQKQSPQATPQAVQKQPPKVAPQAAQKQPSQVTAQTAQKQPSQAAPQTAQKQPSQAAPQTAQKPPSQAAAPQTAQKQPSQKKDPPKDILARTPFTLEEQAAATIPGIPDARVWGDSETEFKRLLPTVSGPWLAISGGGADGAFGAGLLVGWTQSGNRPDFAVVTGASIGALIGPYAFLGSEFDGELTKNFTDITAADVFEAKPTPESFLDTWPLKRLIEKRVTRNLLKAIAAEHMKGRRYLVATTNLDAGRRVIWNMGAIAARGDDKALKLFREVILASASIPGFFQPVSIEVESNGKKFHEMHLDGTITSPFFVAPESSITSQDARLPTDQIYVIINSKITSDFSMPHRQIHAILGRTIGVALVTGLRAELMLITASARQLGIGLNVAHVPEDFTEVNRGLFDHIYMQALFRYGAEQAMNGQVFQNIVQIPVKAQAPTDEQPELSAASRQ